jgi:hypothetical protein
MVARGRLFGGSTSFAGEGAKNVRFEHRVVRVELRLRAPEIGRAGGV